MNSDILLLVNKHLEVMVSAEVQKQLVDYKADNVTDQDTQLTSAQESEVDTMIRDIINNELSISADHIQVDILTATMQLHSMKNYLDTLKAKAEAHDVSLLESFKLANVPTSTYYRAVNGKTDLRYDTAIKVNQAIENFYTLQRIHHDTAALQRANRILGPCAK